MLISDDSGGGRGQFGQSRLKANQHFQAAVETSDGSQSSLIGVDIVIQFSAY